jgi:hypothetical protein
MGCGKSKETKDMTTNQPVNGAPFPEGSVPMKGNKEKLALKKQNQPPKDNKVGAKGTDPKQGIINQEEEPYCKIPLDQIRREMNPVKGYHGPIRAPPNLQ